jgi:predicted AAA+ superfamily ATPase
VVRKIGIFHPKVVGKIGNYYTCTHYPVCVLKRKITEKLLKWKNSEKKKCLLLSGAKRVGKTYAVDRFARENYRNYLYINFYDRPEARKIFDGTPDADTIVKKLSLAYPETDLVPEETLIFLDEIQWCPEARTAFKPFTIDGRFDVIGSGSLPGVKYRGVPSYPAGYETSLSMYSLDFEEFLWAMKVKENIIEDIRNRIFGLEPLEEFVLEKMNEYFRWNMLVGGMPEAVNRYIETGNMAEVLKIQKNTVRLYMDGAAEYAPASDRTKVRSTFASIPVQLSRVYKKFTYSAIGGSWEPRSSTYEGSLQWLYDAGIVSFCRNLTEPVMPLASRVKQNAFKLYMNDTGLLLSMMDTGTRFALMNGDHSVNEGGITENMVAEQFVKQGIDLTYFEKKGSEVDFIINTDGTVTAADITWNRRQSKSLDALLKRPYRIGRAIKLENSNIEKDSSGIIHYPLFASAFMNSVLENTPRLSSQKTAGGV